MSQFPDLSNKLAAPSKKSLFERQKAEADAKRARDEAETAAVYQDFVKSFEDDDSQPDPSSFPTHQIQNFGHPGSKRHFTTGPPKKSGPGSLEPSPLLRQTKPVPRNSGRENRYTDSANTSDIASAFKTEDDQDDDTSHHRSADRAIAKPTMQLSSLPPGTSPAVIKSILPTNLNIDAIRIMPPSRSGNSASTERRTISAIVTLATDTPASEIDSAVNTLQNKYLGWGHHLNLSRHLSSAALDSTLTGLPSLQTALSSLPFGARPIPQAQTSTLSRAPPPGSGFAPPSSYTPHANQHNRGPPPVQVTVTPPSSIKEIKLIHKTLELLLAHGPEFEALLMSRPDVQREEKWAWLWDARSPGGIWYRWRLYSNLRGLHTRPDLGPERRAHRVFDNGAPWLEPTSSLPFEFCTQLPELIAQPDYDSSDEDESGDDDDKARKRRRFARSGRGAPPDDGAALAEPTQTFLNPLQKAKLTHLLARLPRSTGKLRRGDVARVTAFAITHAGAGADEVVDMLVANCTRPLSCSAAAGGEGEEDGETDTSGASLIALFLVSDVLSASSTSGVRHAWRYRSLFESVLTARRTFAKLGRLGKERGLGRLRAEKWRRSVGNVLGLWEGWCVFSSSVQETLAKDFAETAREEQEERERRERSEAEALELKSSSKWKSVDGNGRKNQDQSVDLDKESQKDVAEGDAMEGVEILPVKSAVSDEKAITVDVPMPVPTQALPVPKQALPVEKAEATSRDSAADKTTEQIAENKAALARKQRPKAEDMFAESDED